MVSYNRVKTMKNMPIGTIMPWAGNASSGTFEANIPHGWVLCDGKTWLAKQLPLLASIIGNTYGPTSDGIKNPFPNYGDDDVFQVPNLTNRALIDHENSYLNQSTYQYGQSDAQTVVGSLINGDGTSVTPPTIYSGDGDLEFTMQNSNTLAGVINGFTLNPPTYSKTYYIIGRKLGLKHTPAHTHKGKYSSAIPDGKYIESFQAPSADIEGGKWTSANLKGIGSDTPDAWAGGYGRVTYYDANTQILTDSKKDFYGNYNTGASIIGGVKANQTLSYETIPPVGVQRQIDQSAPSTPSFSDTYNYGHQMKAVYGTAAGGTGVFPPPNTFFGRRNYLGGDKTTTYPTTMHHSAEDPTQTNWSAHNHFTFDITMNIGSLRPPTNISVSNMQTYNVQPIDIPSAVNILADVSTASQSIITIIRAF